MNSFDVVVFKAPKTFDRNGDGGYENVSFTIVDIEGALLINVVQWAWNVPSSCTENGGHIECP